MHRTPREQPDLEVPVFAQFWDDCPLWPPPPRPQLSPPVPAEDAARLQGPGLRGQSRHHGGPKWRMQRGRSCGQGAHSAQLGAPQSAAPGCFLRPGPKTSGGPRSTPLSTELLPPGSAPGEGQGGSTWPAAERISQHRRRRRGIWAAALPVGGLIKDVITAPRPGALIKMLFLVVENCKQLASCTGRNLFTSLGRYAEVMALT